MAEERTVQHPPPDEEDLAEQRRMAIDWSQDFTDALVSKKLSTERIKDDYASSDPAFQAKTENLPKEFDKWRKLRGDGSCGLRALTFGYFENLASLRDPHVWSVEKVRFANINGLLRRSGLEEYIWVEWVEATSKLFDELAQVNTEETAMSVIEEKFNNSEDSMEILTHLRFLISYWLKEEGHRYAHYLPDMSIDQYINTFQVTNSEMDEVSLRAAYDMLLDAGGFTLEVLYLDRSRGDKVTPHVYRPSGNGSKKVGTIHFLYRPGHFDLLYPKLGGPELVVNLVSDLYCGTWTYKDDHLDGIPKSVSSNDAASSSAVKNDGIAAREISNDTETLITLSQGRAGLHEQNDSWREYAVQSKIGTLSGAPVKRNISSMNDRIVLLGNRSPYAQSLLHNKKFGSILSPGKDFIPCSISDKIASKQRRDRGKEAHHSSDNFQPEQFDPRL